MEIIFVRDITITEDEADTGAKADGIEIVVTGKIDVGLNTA